jgi:diguanylate cyclase (GGDEF)-like protein
MHGVERQNERISVKGTAGRAVLVAVAPLVPLVIYLALAPFLEGAFRIDLILVLGIAALAGFALAHVARRQLMRPVDAVTELLEGRLGVLAASAPRAEPRRLAAAAQLALDRVDALAARIEKSALADELTGLPNRRAVLPQIKGALSRARRTGEPFAIALVDLDRLRLVNEQLGEEFGDAALREFAELLRSELRASDVAARWRGEEFLLLLPTTPVDAAVGVVDRLRELVAARRLATIDGEPITVTSGVAGFQITDLHVEEIITRADEALEGAKRAGRNRVLALDTERFHEI